jgi:hypothetical protein
MALLHPEVAYKNVVSTAIERYHKSAVISEDVHGQHDL